MKKPVFTGSAAALVTPFTDRGVDYDRLAAALDRQAEGGTAAVVVCGTTGEAATLSEAERASIIEFTAVYTRSRMKVIAGIGGNDTASPRQTPRGAPNGSGRTRFCSQRLITTKQAPKESSGTLPTSRSILSCRSSFTTSPAGPAYPVHRSTTRVWRRYRASTA